MKENVYKKLSTLRQDCGYTYQDMAEKIGVCKAYYWQIEHKNRRLYYDIAIKIAKVFNKKPDEIFYDETKIEK